MFLVQKPLFPKLLCTERSNSVPLCTALSTHHQISLRNFTDTSAWHLNIKTEAIQLVTNLVSYRVETFSLIFTSQQSYIIQFVSQVHMYTHVETSSIKFTISDKELVKQNFIYYVVKVSTSNVIADKWLPLLIHPSIYWVMFFNSRKCCASAFQKNFSALVSFITDDFWEYRPAL